MSFKMFKVLVFAWLSCVVAPPPPGGASSQNPHVTEWGDYAATSTSCTNSATTGLCTEYTIKESDVLASLLGFTTHNSGVLSNINTNYFAQWWIDNVGTETDVASDFCTNGAGAGQTSTAYTYDGVSYSSANGEFTLSSKGVPPGDVENYCSIEGGTTPPLMGTSFTDSYSQSFSLSPSTKSREIISNQVGWAVDGVVIFSPYTGIGSVAPYDESLDTCVGHPANNRYHYHGFPPCLHGEDGTPSVSPIAHSKIYGWAFDGFPIYGPFGYTDGADTMSTVIRLESKYKCKVNGDDCSSDSERANANNWVYSSTNSGQLDECNGRFTKTPEFPNGMYVYVLNINAAGLPDFPGVPYCMHGAETGTVQEDGTTQAPTNNGGTTLASSSGTTQPPENTDASEAVSNVVSVGAIALSSVLASHIFMH